MVLNILHSKRRETSLVVQWVRLYAPNAGGPWVRSLVRELRSHMLCGMAKKLKKKNHSLKVNSAALLFPS